MYSFETSGVCSRAINFDIVGNKVINVNFIGGCDGNLQAISKLVEGMKIEEVINKLRGIDCGGKGTSCPDQFSKALQKIASAK